jgi:hypothetical protein
MTSMAATGLLLLSGLMSGFERYLSRMCFAVLAEMLSLSRLDRFSMNFGSDRIRLDGPQKSSIILLPAAGSGMRSEKNLKYYCSVVSVFNGVSKLRTLLVRFSFCSFLFVFHQNGNSNLVL